MLRMAAEICYAANAFILIVFGARYLSSKEFQPYHAAAIGRDWKSLDPALQVLLLSFIRGVGAALLAVAISTVTLLIFPFREGATWATYALPLPLLLTNIAAVWGTRSVARATGVPVPERPPLIALGLTVIGFVFSLF
jgi:hypothetical protein